MKALKKWFTDLFFIEGNTLVIGEVPKGKLDGYNTEFYLSKIPVKGTVALYLNGVRQKEGDDYKVEGNKIIFITQYKPFMVKVEPPQRTDNILVDFWY